MNSTAGPSSGAADAPTHRATEPPQAHSARMLISHGRSALLLTLIIAVVIGAYFFPQAPVAFLAAWIACVGAVTVWRLHLLRRFPAGEVHDEVLEAWARRYRIASVVAGVSIGAVWWGVAPAADLEDQLLLMFVFAGISITASSTLGSSYATFLLYCAGVCSHAMAWQFAQGDRTSFVLGFLSLVFLGAMALVGRAYNKAVAWILQLSASNRQLHQHQQRLSDFADLGADLFWESDADGRYSYLSSGYDALIGIPSREMLGRALTDPSGPCFIPDGDDRDPNSGFSEHSVAWCRAEGVSPTYMLCSAVPIRDADGRPVGLRGTVRDVTSEHLLAEELAHLAHHDSLTGLANRREFERALRTLLKERTRKGRVHGVCYLDLDQFKVVNDTCGHAAGDALLNLVAGEIRARVRPNDTLARLGGDEFGLLLVGSSRDEAAAVVERVRAAVEAIRFRWEHSTFSVTVSIGVVLVEETTTDLAEVLMHADSACFRAKDNGRNRVQFFESDDLALTNRKGEMKWVSRITHAIDHDGLHLVGQPIVAFPDGAEAGRGGVRHLELLLRMTTPEGEPISPARFLPAAERYHIITRLDRWVIEEAFRWMLDSPDRIANVETISINLSGHSITNATFLEMLLELLAEEAVPSQKICFEITETAAMNNLDAALHFVKTVREAGCRFALDDFGSGSASFGYLRKLPVDYVKIDGIFVRDMLHDPVDFAMVKSINEIGHIMGKKTIAEYVETEAIFDTLREMGVDYAQGYATGEPMPLTKLFPPERTPAPDRDGIAVVDRA